MKNEIKPLVVLLIDFILYVSQFIVIPLIFPTSLSHIGDEIVVITTISVTLAGMVIVSDKMRYWLIGVMLYLILIYTYYPKGIYGIGRTFLGDLLVDVDDFGIWMFIIGILFYQFGTWCFIKIIKLMIKNLKSCKVSK